MKGVSIQVKILALLLSLIIAPTSILAVVSFTASSGTLEEEIVNSIKGTTQNIKSTMNLFFKSYEEGVSTIASDRHMKNFAMLDELVRKETLEALQEFSDNHKDFQYVYLATPDKDFYIYPPAQMDAGFDPTTRVWYQAAVEKKDVIWTEPFTDAVTGKTIITVAEPVYSASNELVGVIGADLSLDQLTNIMNSFKIGEAGYFILSNTKGDIITHPQTEKIGQPLATKQLFDAANSDKPTNFIDYVYKGERKLTFYDTIDKTGWRVFGTFTYSEITDKTSMIVKDAIIASLILILIAVGLGILLSRPMIKGIKKLSQDMVVIGNGDFTVKSHVKSKDEIGLLSVTLNKMAEELRGIMSNIKNMAIEVSNSSNALAATSEESTATTEEIARTIQEIVKVTEDQAYSTEEGLKKTTLLAQRILEVSKEIEKITEMVKLSSNLNVKGISSVALLKDKSDANNAAAASVGSAVLEMDKSAEQIGMIVETISSMAGQTNLLALNASIEAARAGESGRGFAVVADEIRKLAEQSKGASDTIRQLIHDIQAQSKNAVGTMEEARSIVVEQYRAVSETEVIFDEISSTIVKLGDEIAIISELNTNMLEKKDEILTTMESISASAEETSASTEQISASTHEQLAATDEVAKTAERLNNVAQSLSVEVSKFKV